MIDAEPGEQTLCQHATEAFASYRDGDRTALDELVAVMTPLLWHTVRAQGVHSLAAEDVVQTVWMRLLHSAETIRDPATIVKWLLTSARREAWRVAKRVRADMVKTAAILDRDETVDIPLQREQSPDELTVDDDQRQRLWEHVLELPPRCRELLRVIAFADRPDYALIAESLGMPIGSIGPTRGRCLARLRRDLASDPGWEGTGM